MANKNVELWTNIDRSLIFLLYFRIATFICLSYDIDETTIKRYTDFLSRNVYLRVSNAKNQKSYTESPRIVRGDLFEKYVSRWKNTLSLVFVKMSRRTVQFRIPDSGRFGL